MRRLGDDLLTLSADLHAHPETAFCEHRSAARIARLARSAGLELAVGVGGLPTALAGQVGDGPAVALLAEYDALPRLGHACGHNVVAAASVGAALALAPYAGVLGGAVRLVGTPAEEGLGGGKERLARAGVFDGAVAALMVHPGTQDVALPATRAASGLRVTVTGRAAHSALAPELGVNALDGLLLGYTAMGALRPHLPDGAQVSAVVSEGGDAPNVVPDRVVGEVLVRARSASGLADVRRRVTACFTAGASAVGATAMAVPVGLPYEQLRGSPVLAQVYAGAAQQLGRDVHLRAPRVLGLGGSTDVGNLSRRLPSLQPHIAVAPPGTAPHSPEFAAAAVSTAAQRAVLDGATALAWTVLQLWADPSLRARLRRPDLRPPQPRRRTR